MPEMKKRENSVTFKRESTQSKYNSQSAPRQASQSSTKSLPPEENDTLEPSRKSDKKKKRRKESSRKERESIIYRLPKMNKSKRSKKRRSSSPSDSFDKSSSSDSLNSSSDSETEVERTSINVPKYSNRKHKNQHYHQLKSVDIGDYDGTISVNVYLQRIAVMINGYGQESVLSVLPLYIKRAAFDWYNWLGDSTHAKMAVDPDT